MKNKTNYWQRIVVIVGITLVLAIAQVPGAIAEQPKVFKPDKAVFGMTYGDWAAAWWQYVFSIPVPDNPLFDTTGEKCDVRQAGPVFFLVGISSGNELSGVPVTRMCTVPYGKAIFFPVINLIFENVTEEPNPVDAWTMRSIVEGFIDSGGIVDIMVTVDGNKLEDIEDFRVQSPEFQITVPEDNILGVPAASSTGLTGGFYVMLKPLKPGNHEVHFEGKIPAFEFDLNVTYNLTVE